VREKERICILLCVTVLATRFRLFLEVNDGVYLLDSITHTRESFVSKVTLFWQIFSKFWEILTHITASDLLRLI